MVTSCATLIQSVVSGSIDLELILKWIASNGGEECPVPRQSFSPDCLLEEFCHSVLEYIREEARPILAAARSNSQSTASKESAYKKASNQKGAKQNGRASAGVHRRPASPKQQRLSQLDKRLDEPGLVDDKNFPALTSAPSSPAKALIREKSASRRVLAAPLSVATRRVVPEETNNGLDTPTRKKIIPTKVENILSVDQAFVGQPLTPKSAAVEELIQNATTPLGKSSSLSPNLDPRGEHSYDSLRSRILFKEEELSRPLLVSQLECSGLASSGDQSSTEGGMTGMKGADDAVSNRVLSARSSPQKGEGGMQTTRHHPLDRLSAKGHRLSQLHAGILQSRLSSLNIIPEVCLLLNLLTLSPTIKLSSQQTSLLWCGDVAAEYAGTVLVSAGMLLRGLGTNALTELAAARLAGYNAGGGVCIAAQQHLLELDKRTLRTDKPYNEAVLDPVLGGISAQLDDKNKFSKLPDETRKEKNREDCKDDWCAIIKTAAAQIQSFSNQSQNDFEGINEELVLIQMQTTCTAFFRTLRPDNLASFAELFCSAILQAAATGEAVLDQELSILAKRSLPKFQSLTQRFQGGMSTDQQSNTSFRGGEGQAAGNTTYKKKSGKASLSQEGLHASLSIISEFPQHQRVYVMFLEAADSHRFNAALEQRLLDELHEMHARVYTLPVGFSSQVVRMATIATFLSYLCFLSVESGSSHRGNAVEVMPILKTAIERAGLHFTLPWVVKYLWFAPFDALKLDPVLTEVMTLIVSLKSSLLLNPAGATFGPTAYCLRGLLESFCEKYPGHTFKSLVKRPPSDTTVDALLKYITDHAEALSNSLASADGGLCTHYSALCVPSLDLAVKVFQPGRRWESYPDHMPDGGQGRKIRPTRGASAEIQNKMHEAREEQSPDDVLKVKMQRSFLDQYSSSDSPVKLRDIVDYLTDVLAANAVDEVLKTVMVPAVERANGTLTSAAERVAEDLRVPTLNTVDMGVLRQVLDSIAEKEILETTQNVLGQAPESAIEKISKRSSKAVVAMTPSYLGEAVLGTAAAIVAEGAICAYNKRLVSKVTSAVRIAITSHVPTALAAGKRKSKYVLQNQ